MRRRTVPTVAILISAVASLMQISGCGSSGASNPSNNPSSNIQVLVTPTNASVQVGQSLQFMATVQNDPSNKGVSWRIGNSGDTICTAALCGTIDQSGKYTAPAAVSNNPDLAKIPVGATSIADPSKYSDWSLVTITPAPAPAIVVTVSPARATVQVGQSFQFTATVQNDPANKGVTWNIGNSGDSICTPTLCGTIDSNGKYTAPAIVPSNPDLVTIGISVGATSVADPSKQSVWSLVTLTPAPDSVIVSPPTVTLRLNEVQQFTATVGSDIPSNNVTWSLSGVGCAGASCGTIDTTGKYTAPAAAPSPTTVTVTATSTAVPTISGNSTVSITGGAGSNAQLSGQYAFLYKGFNSSGFLTVAGTFTADGAGGFVNLEQSEVILNTKGYNLGDQLHPSSSYVVNADHRGKMVLNTNVGYPIDDSTVIFSIALDSFTESGIATRGRVASADPFVLEAGFGSGFIIRQDPAAVAANSIDGSYAFGFSGSGTSGVLAAVGRFTANANGSDNFGGALNLGQVDLNDSGTVAMNQSLTGTYDEFIVPGWWNVLVTLPGFPNQLYFFAVVVSADEVIFIEADARPDSSSPAISGVALRQSGGPYTANSLDGPAVFNLTGANDLSIGLETFNGSGAFIGTSDENNGGLITANLAIAGNYVVDVNGLGRGTISLQGGQPRPFYLVAPDEGFILDMGQSPETGMFEPQTGGSFDNSSVSGNYVFGSLPSPENSTLALNSGVWTADGTGSLEGQEDNGNVFGGQFGGAYAVASNGRATMVVTPVIVASSKWIMYVISSSRIIAIRIDPGVMPNTIEIIEK